MLFTVITWGLSGCGNYETADLILKGGMIYTMNPAHPYAEAVAVKGDRILYVGSNRHVSRYKGADTEVMDLRGSTVLPGLIDAHAHLGSLGRFLSELNLVGTGSPAEIRRMVLERMESAEDGEWITGRGWDQNDWEEKRFPTWKDLEGTESHPVYLRRVDGHAAWVNRTALAICGVDRNTPDPDGGWILRDENGDPTGVLIDNAADLVSLKMPQPSFETRLEWVKKAVAECHRAGLVGVHDAGVDSIKLEVYRRLLEDGELNLRVYAMLHDTSKAVDWLEERFRRGPFTSEDRFLSVRSVKLFADGALGSRGAALLEPYRDDPQNLGLLIHDRDFFVAITEKALQHGFQVCTHCIGDAAVRLVLDAYEAALKSQPVTDHRLRIEHAQVIAPEDMPRFAELGVIPSMQPTHATSDMPWAEDRLGPERIRGAYAWRELLDSGCRIPCGSDFPVEDPNPFRGIYAAVTRQDEKGRPEGGWYPDQKMTVEEAVRGFTLDAAYAQFADSLQGTIAEGKLADFTVIDRNIFKVEPREILHTKVIYTIIGGEIVYAANSRR